MCDLDFAQYIILFCISWTKTSMSSISIQNDIYIFYIVHDARNLDAKKTLFCVEFSMDMDLGDTLYLKGSEKCYQHFCSSIGRKIWLKNHLT